MKQVPQITAEAAAALVKDGDVLMAGGFGMTGAPIHLLHALAATATRDLTYIGNNVGEPGLGGGRLLRNGQIKKAIGSFFTSNPEAVAAAQSGALNVQLLPQGTLSEAIRAGGAGIGGFYTPTASGTVIAAGHETRDINGRPHVFVEALRANVAFIRAWQADTAGRLVYRMTEQNFNKAMAMAADVAEAAAAAPAEHAAAADAHATQETSAPPAQAAQQCAAPTLAEMAGLSQTEVQVLQALSARREALDQRAESYDTQDELMAAAEQRLNERLTELRQLEANVNDLLGRLDEAQEQRLASLVDVYQRMRAKDAAEVFNGLDDEVLVQVASRMRQANLAEVLGRMDAERARQLTTMLADRARPPSGGQDLLQRARGANAASGG